MDASQLSLADLYDSDESAFQSLSLPLRSFGRRQAFTGTVRTVRCLEDNALVKSLLTGDGEGQVLVVDGGGSLRSALVGDQIARAALENGWAGIIVNGAIRDSVEIDRLDLGVKALGTNPRRSAKIGAGRIDVDIEFGGVVFRPGAQVFSDPDGVLVRI